MLSLKPVSVLSETSFAITNNNLASGTMLLSYPSSFLKEKVWSESRTYSVDSLRDIFSASFSEEVFVVIINIFKMVQLQ
jgi:hypothetical protein